MCCFAISNTPLRGQMFRGLVSTLAHALRLPAPESSIRVQEYTKYAPILRFQNKVKKRVAATQPAGELRKSYLIYLDAKSWILVDQLAINGPMAGTKR